MGIRKSTGRHTGKHTMSNRPAVAVAEQREDTLRKSAATSTRRRTS